MTDSKPSRPNRLREHREAAGLTQQELADALGAGRTTIIRAEQGTQAPSLELADRIADALDTTIDALFSSSDRDADPYGIAAWVTETVTAKPSMPDGTQVWHLRNPRGRGRKLDAVVQVEIVRLAPRMAKRTFEILTERGDD